MNLELRSLRAWVLAAITLTSACGDDAATGAGGGTGGSPEGGSGQGGAPSTGGSGEGGVPSTGGGGEGGATSCDAPLIPVAEDAGEFLGAFIYLGQSSLGAPVDVVYLEFPDGAPAVGVLPVTDADYSTCASCVTFYRGCDADLANCEKIFLAQAGSIDLTSIGAEGETFAGTLEGAAFIEITLDAELVSTPVAGGEAFCWDSYSFSATIQ